MSKHAHARPQAIDTGRWPAVQDIPQAAAKLDRATMRYEHSTAESFASINDSLAKLRAQRLEGRGHLLLVEDSDIVARAYTKALYLDGWRVDAVATGEEATALLETRRYEVVIVDLVLKRSLINGADVAAKARPRCEYLVLMSGEARDRLAAVKFETHADATVEKPAGSERLLGVIHSRRIATPSSEPPKLGDKSASVVKGSAEEPDRK